MSKYKYLLEELEKIRNGDDSFLGCDGGNITSDIWFCGVEFGGTPKEMNTYYKNHVKYYIKDNLKIPFRENYQGSFLKSTFDRYLTVMYLTLFEGYNSDKIADSTVIDDFLKNKLYDKNSKSFKLNLFPIAKKDVSWDKEIEEEFNIQRDLYYSLILKKRAKFFKRIISKDKPKTIICFSPDNHSDYFINAFFNKQKNINYFWDTLNITGQDFKISVLKNKEITVIIIPFLGRGNKNLSSHEKVYKMTEYLIKNHLQKVNNSLKYKLSNS